MPIHALQWFFAKRIAALAISFLLISDFNAILVSVAILLLCIVFETVCRNIVIARRSIYPGQGDMIFVFLERRRLFVRVNNSHFNRVGISLAV